MSRPAERTATYEDLCQVPDHLLAQIIHGQLITLPRPAPKHARASSMVGGKLVPAYDEGRGGPGGWWILDEPELHLACTSWCPTWPAGGGNGCRPCRTRLISTWRPIGCVRCFPPPLPAWIAPTNCPSMPPMVSATPGSSTRMRKPWKCLPWSTGAGGWNAFTRKTTKSARRRSRRWGLAWGAVGVSRWFDTATDA